jgi:hypothetical protein
MFHPSRRRRSQATQPAGTVAIEQCEQGLYLSPVFDVDQDGRSLPLTDGIFVTRYLAGFRGTPSSAESLDQATQIQARIEAIQPVLDIDDDDSVRAPTDGVLLIRYLAGSRDSRSFIRQFLNGTQPDVAISKSLGDSA